ncbi:PLP-dependent cysteine synthase family protein [Effusibacillus pohliae]|uniref:PLP-dependent cysteine synthase family protein n=1 Tax=Effusibacillus pohliae TaxID=232270 RepID=UPI00035F2585|nr:cysteine synthase family protein [Effusibacillus pohliae]
MEFINFIQDKRLKRFTQKLGNTPVVEIPAVPGSGRIFAKCEWYNPTGSVKDRAAYEMMMDVLLEKERNNQQHLHILEYSGGNLGISLATICNLLEINLTLVLSSGSHKSLLKKLQMLGAKVELVDKQKGFWGVMETAFRLSESSDSYTFLYQHRNEANFRAHRNGTAIEILRQIPNQIDAWVASIGTGGTLMGVYETLSSKYPNIQLHAVTPAELPYGSDQPPNGLRKFAGSGGLGCGRKQYFVERNEGEVTRHWTYRFEETLEEAKRFYVETGVQIGTSAAANLLAARSIAAELGTNSTVVTIFPDAGAPEEWSEIYGQN